MNLKLYHNKFLKHGTNQGTKGKKKRGNTGTLQIAKKETRKILKKKDLQKTSQNHEKLSST